MVRNGDADLGVTFNRVAQPDIEVVHRQPAPVVCPVLKVIATELVLAPTS